MEGGLAAAAGTLHAALVSFPSLETVRSTAGVLLWVCLLCTSQTAYSHGSVRRPSAPFAQSRLCAVLPSGERGSHTSINEACKPRRLFTKHSSPNTHPATPPVIHLTHSPEAPSSLATGPPQADFRNEPKVSDAVRVWTPGAVDFFRILNEQLAVVVDVNRDTMLLRVAQVGGPGSKCGVKPAD